MALSFQEKGYNIRKIPLGQLPQESVNIEGGIGKVAVALDQDELVNSLRIKVGKRSAADAEKAGRFLTRLLFYDPKGSVITLFQLETGFC
ncbi:MAG: hypothetical protein K2N78_05505 [Oscillospiraceae bacterium]|nr:hypothetical protein [Oscillospiraceae bacterium]